MEDLELVRVVAEVVEVVVDVDVTAGDGETNRQ
jgi:hypothetical protein